MSNSTEGTVGDEVGDKNWVGGSCGCEKLPVNRLFGVNITYFINPVDY